MRATLLCAGGLLAVVSCGESRPRDNDGDEDGGRPPIGVPGSGGVAGPSVPDGDDDSGGSGADPGVGGAFSGAPGFGGSAGGSAGAISVAGGGAGGGGAGPVTGGSSGGAGEGGEGGGGVGCTALRGRLRDFQPAPAGHPDFEPHLGPKGTAVTAFYNDVEPGIVQQLLDSSSWKPLYAGPTAGTNTTYGPTTFASWFVDTPGVNIGIDYTLELVSDPSEPNALTFDRSPFFPIDDGADCAAGPATPCLLGNSTNYPTHNYAMTFELHASFVYRSGSFFSFSGDDDTWVFIRDVLAIDLGGIHQRSEGSVALDEVAAALQLEEGEEYRLDFFWAERHVTLSNFRVDTNLEFVDCGIEPPS